MPETTEIAAKSDRINFCLRLTINTALVLLFVKLWYFLISQNEMKSVYLVSFVQDAFLLTVNYFVFVFLPQKVKFLEKFRILRISGGILFFTGWLITAAVSFVYTSFLFDLMSFPINIFSLSLEKVSFFMEYLMNIELLMALLCGTAVILLLSHYFPAKLGWKQLPALSSIVIVLLFIPTVLRPAINPLVFSFQEQIILSFYASSDLNRLTAPVADADLAENYRFLHKASDAQEGPITSKYSRIVVLVMEGINANEYRSESLSSDDNSFLNRYGHQIVSYENYYCLNLDSYTSLIAMLNSIFIPYQAYLNENKYNFVNSRNNFVRFLRSNGFSTHFLTSYGEQQKRFVPDIGDWSEVSCMQDIDGNTQYASVKTNKIEMACEDLAVFDDLMEILRNNARPFVFQEMVYGHTSAWKEQTGIGTHDYYDQYFNKTVQSLTEHNLIDSTLLVVVSDHGPRDNAYAAENYHIPMLLWASDLKQEVKKDFVSHLDFRDILLEAMTGKQHMSRHDTIYTLGNSGELIYGRITADKKHVFINNRMLNVRGNVEMPSIKAFSSSFQDYMNYFESLRGAEN